MQQLFHMLFSYIILSITFIHMQKPNIFILTSVLATFYCIGNISAQEVVKEIDKKEGKIEIQADPRIEILSNRYNKTHEIRGYRIQIISSPKKDEAKKAKSQFASRYQQMDAHEIYQQPFFIIKVGDFLTKLEAEKYHREIEEFFPGSFIVPDVIEPYNQYVVKATD